MHPMHGYFHWVLWRFFCLSGDKESTNSVPKENENDKNDAIVNNVQDNQRDQDEETNEKRKVKARVGSLWDYFFKLTCTKYMLLDITKHNNTKYWIIIKW